MDTRALGNRDLQITRIGFGSWAIGGGNWEFGWGAQDDAQAIAAMQRAIEVGMNWIDTAAVYGLGHSEELVGRAVRGMPNKPLIFTKCSMRWNVEREVYRELTAKSVREECEGSLKRLGVDAIDLYQIHWPNPEEQIEEGWTEMARLRDEGKVRYIGVSNFNVDQMKRLQRIAPITSLQPPYNLLRRDMEAEVLPYAQEQGMGVIVYSPMASGILTGAMTRERIANLPADDWRRNNRNYNEPLLSRNLRLAELLTRVGEKQGCSAGEVAIAWTLRHPAVTGAIVGARSAEQVDGIVGGEMLQLDDEDVAEIEGAVAV